MKIWLEIRKSGSTVFEGVVDVTDAESFGTFWADVWNAEPAIGRSGYQQGGLV